MAVTVHVVQQSLSLTCPRVCIICKAPRWPPGSQSTASRRLWGTRSDISRSLNMNLKGSQGRLRGWGCTRRLSEQRHQPKPERNPLGAAIPTATAPGASAPGGAGAAAGRGRQVPGAPGRPRGARSTAATRGCEITPPPKSFLCPWSLLKRSKGQKRSSGAILSSKLLF